MQYRESFIASEKLQNFSYFKKLINKNHNEAKRALKIFLDREKDLNEHPQWNRASISERQELAKHHGFILDEYLRLAFYPGKVKIECPKQTDKTAVILAIGQSNISNSHEKFFKSQHGDKVVNYYNGDCFIANSPLLGSENFKGESLTLLGNKLINSKKFDRIILIPSGVGGTNMYQWKKGEKFNFMLADTIKKVTSRFLITHVLWQQGEADASGYRSGEEYKSGFYSMLSTIRELNVLAPVFVAVSTHCYNNIPLDNPVSRALKTLPSNSEKIFIGADTDKYINDDQRYDKCHFNSRGQEKFSLLWTKIILEHMIKKV